MFFWLRRLAIVLGWIVTGLLLLYAYQQREVARPVWTALEVLLNRNANGPVVRGQITGVATRLFPGGVFFFKEESGLLYTIKLAALTVATNLPVATISESPTNDLSRVFLSERILSRPLRIDLIHVNENRVGMGFVYTGATNLNLAMLAAGLARLQRDQIGGLPFKVQYEYFAKEWEARSQRLGLWGQAEP